MTKPTSHPMRHAAGLLAGGLGLAAALVQDAGAVGQEPWRRGGAFFGKITEGGKRMPPYEKTLAEQDRWHVVTYQSRHRMKTHSPTAESTLNENR